MIEWIVDFSIRRRWAVVALSAVVMMLGGYALTMLPIDAVPDITNKQVQINTSAPALSPAEIEKQITFPIETALAGAPGLQTTRSLSRNGFSQVTAVFSEPTDIYFARQQIAERLTEVRSRLPPGIEPRVGPTSTGLGEIYMWTVHFAGPGAASDGATGLQGDGRFLTPEGALLTSDIEKSAYLRTVQDWILKPQIRMVPGVAGVDSIGGYLKQYQVNPDAAKLIALGLTFADVAKAIEGNNVSRGARYIERNGEGIVVRSGGRIENIGELGAVVVSTRGGVPVRIRDLATFSIGGETRTGSASENGREVVVGTALMLIGANSRTVSAAVDARLRAIAPSLPPGIEVKPVLDRTQLVDATIGLRCPDHPVPRALCRAVGPLATTSANVHGGDTPVTAAGVADVFGGLVAVVLDGGPCEGSPSTVVDCTGAEPKLLREGRLPWTEILSAAGADQRDP